MKITYNGAKLDADAPKLTKATRAPGAPDRTSEMTFFDVNTIELCGLIANIEICRGCTDRTIVEVKGSPEAVENVSVRYKAQDGFSYLIIGQYNRPRSAMILSDMQNMKDTEALGVMISAKEGNTVLRDDSTTIITKTAHQVAIKISTWTAGTIVINDCRGEIEIEEFKGSLYVDVGNDSYVHAASVRNLVAYAFDNGGSGSVTVDNLQNEHAKLEITSDAKGDVTVRRTPH